MYTVIQHHNMQIQVCYDIYFICNIVHSIIQYNIMIPYRIILYKYIKVSCETMSYHMLLSYEIA